MTETSGAGLQAERTALSWRRTCLALLSGSLIAARILPEQLGSAAALIGLVGVASASTLLVTGHRRYRQYSGVCAKHGKRSTLAGGALLVSVSLFVVFGATIGIAFTVASAVG